MLLANQRSADAVQDLNVASRLITKWRKGRLGRRLQRSASMISLTEVAELNCPLPYRRMTGAGSGWVVSVTNTRHLLWDQGARAVRGSASSPKLLRKKLTLQSRSVGTVSASRRLPIARARSFQPGRRCMPQGSKARYTKKQDRKAEHIEKGYEKRGVPKKEAERRAWATVNKDDGGGKKSGSGRGKTTGHPAAKKGGRIGGTASASRSAAARSASAKKAAATRKRAAKKK